MKEIWANIESTIRRHLSERDTTNWESVIGSRDVFQRAFRVFRLPWWTRHARPPSVSMP